jgi:hypothetical protein
MSDAPEGCVLPAIEAKYGQTYRLLDGGITELFASGTPWIWWRTSSKPMPWGMVTPTPWWRTSVNNRGYSLAGSCAHWGLGAREWQGRGVMPSAKPMSNNIPSDISPAIFLGARLTINNAWRPTSTSGVGAFLFDAGQNIAGMIAKIDDETHQFVRFGDRFDALDGAERGCRVVR